MTHNRAILIVLILMMLAGMAACKSRPAQAVETPSSSESEDTPSLDDEYSAYISEKMEEERAESAAEATKGEAEQATRDFFDALMSGSGEEIALVTDYADLLQLQEGGQNDQTHLEILKCLSYEILEIQVLSEEAATAQVKTATVDMNRVLPDYMMKAAELEYNNALSESPLAGAQMEEEYFKILRGLLQNTNKTAFFQTLDVRLSYTDGQWWVQVDEALRSAVFGDFFNAQKTVGENAGAENG